MEGPQLQSGLPMSHLRLWATPACHGHFQILEVINNLATNIFGEKKPGSFLCLTDFLVAITKSRNPGVRFLQDCWIVFP